MQALEDKHRAATTSTTVKMSTMEEFESLDRARASAEEYFAQRAKELDSILHDLKDKSAAKAAENKKLEEDIALLEQQLEQERSEVQEMELVTQELNGSARYVV